MIACEKFIRETYDMRDAAAVLGVKTSTLRRAVVEGHVPAVRVPGTQRPRLEKTEVGRMLQAQAEVERLLASVEGSESEEEEMREAHG